MKKLFITLFIVGSLFQTEAKAEEVVVFYGDAHSSDYALFTKGDFDINKELGRAWVTLEFAPSYEDGLSSEIRTKIPGMSFDQTTKEVVIDTDSGRVVCAYEKRGLFGIKTLQKTNNCKFKESFSTVKVDDGFKVYKVQKRTITFIY